MNFPLDFIWIKGDEVVEITAAVPVDRMNIRPSQAVDKVIEVNSGWAAENGVKIGDEVSYEPISA